MKAGGGGHGGGGYGGGGHGGGGGGHGGGGYGGSGHGGGGGGHGNNNLHVIIPAILPQLLGKPHWNKFKYLHLQINSLVKYEEKYIQQKSEEVKLCYFVQANLVITVT